MVPEPPPPPPVPISATRTLPDIAFVTFDQDLVIGPLEDSLWTWRSNNRAFEALNAEVNAGAVVELTGLDVGPDVGPNVISFSPPPFDVLSLGTGLPAAAFVDFPLT